MTINGSTNSSAWTYKLEVTETATSIENRTSTVQVKTYLGRANSQSYLGGGYSNSVSITGASSQTSSGTIPYPTYINGGAWLLLKTFTFTVPNNSNPTVVTINSTFSSGDFTPSSASASGTMQLTILHLNPTIQSAEMTETNATMINLGVPDTTIVRWLSQKQIKLHATAYDSANLSYSIWHPSFDYTLPSNGTYQSSNTFNADYRTHEFGIGSGNKAMLMQDIIDDKGGNSGGWINVTVNGVERKPDAIPYSKPSIERTSTSIKRKSGGGVNLTDNKVSLNLKATIYKANNVIGNYNSVTQVGYKIWDTDSSEPASYTNITPLPTPDANGVITISDLEISNVSYTDMYNYKIIVKDRFNYTDEILDGTIPIGVSVWTEYKDRVDFLALTVEQNNPFEYSNDEIKVGKWLNGETIYRKVIDIGYLPNASSSTMSHNVSNLGQFTKISGLAVRSSDNDTLPIPYVTFNANNSGGITIYADNTNITIRTTTDRSSYEGYVILEYTKS